MLDFRFVIQQKLTQPRESNLSLNTDLCFRLSKQMSRVKVKQQLFWVCLEWKWKWSNDYFEFVSSNLTTSYLSVQGWPPTERKQEMMAKAKVTPIGQSTPLKIIPETGNFATKPKNLKQCFESEDEDGGRFGGQEDTKAVPRKGKKIIYQKRPAAHQRSSSTVMNVENLSSKDFT